MGDLKEAKKGGLLGTISETTAGIGLTELSPKKEAFNPLHSRLKASLLIVDSIEY
jgi:hypothetical protein